LICVMEWADALSVNSANLTNEFMLHHLIENSLIPKTKHLRVSANYRWKERPCYKRQGCQGCNVAFHSHLSWGHDPHIYRGVGGLILIENKYKKLSPSFSRLNRSKNRFGYKSVWNQQKNRSRRLQSRLGQVSRG
jgi:hypothetical protein